MNIGEQSLSDYQSSEIRKLLYEIMNLVSDEKYERAVKELNTLLESQPHFPTFKHKATRYVLYSIDLINAIKLKRSFPGKHALTSNKQAELKKKINEHFDELQKTLHRIERIQVHMKMDDLRSTVWVVRAGAFCGFLMIFSLFLLEMNHGVLTQVMLVVDDFVYKVAGHLF